MFRIGEFSKLAQVTVKALRLYDERGLLVPARVDRSSGYRFYSAAQLPRLQFTGPPLALYHDGEYRKQDVDIEVAAPFAGRLPVHPRVRERAVRPPT